jgi:hypothetical protein
MSGSYICTPRNETVISKTELLCSASQFLLSYICERFIYFQIGLPILLQEYMWTDPGNIQIAHRHMNVEIWTEVVQFPENKFTNGFFVAVLGAYSQPRSEPETLQQADLQTS